MKALTTMALTLGLLIALGKAGGLGQTRADEKKVAVTVWVLSYERRDANPLADDRFLPKLIEPALAKLKAKGGKKANFNFRRKQLYLWFEGKQGGTLKDIQTAFPLLGLKEVAQATFPAH
jgi:hypothetical protein